MSIKPSVVCIKGVHSITGPDKTSDIGFPQLELEKLFDGAMIVETADTAYDSSKQYIYYDSNSQIVIQDEGHFNCIKNGYYSIANGINHYYTKSGNNYNYNAVPDTSTWASKWSFSNTITGKNLYSINSEIGQIFIDGDGYYKKENNDYVKQSILTYNTYNNSLQVSWDVSNKYNGNEDLDDNLDPIIVWSTSSGTMATSGYYLSVDEKSDNTYKIQLLNLAFTGGVLPNNIDTETLYRLSDDFNFQNNELYIKSGNNFEKLEVNQSQHIFTTDPTTDSNFYIYQKGADWSYPNIEGPEYSILAETDGIYDSSSFPLYTIATVTKISKTQHDSYTVYEKSAAKINYNYSTDANSLKFVFTDKTVSEVLNACGFSNNIGLEKYVHLTNLEYNK